MANITPLRVNVSDAELDDLRNRLRRTRLAPEFANDDWRYGTNGAYLKEFLHYWETAYDWRHHEAAINAQPNFMTRIDGIPIHFIHARGTGRQAQIAQLPRGIPTPTIDRSADHDSAGMRQPRRDGREGEPTTHRSGN